MEELHIDDGYLTQYQGRDLQNTTVISQIFQEYINVVANDSMAEAMKHFFYAVATTAKKLDTMTGKENVYDQIFKNNYLGRQPLRSDNNPFGVGSVGHGKMRRSAPKLLNKRRAETSVSARVVLDADNKEKKGMIGAIMRHYEMRGIGNVTQPLEWAEAGIYQHWLPMDDNTVDKDLNEYVVTDMLFKLMEFAERDLLSEEDIASLIHCKSGIGRSAMIELKFICYRFLRGHKEVVDRLNTLYEKGDKWHLLGISENDKNNKDTLRDIVNNADILLSDRLALLTRCAARHIGDKDIGKRSQVHLGDKRQKYCTQVLTHLHPLILAGKDNMESRPPNYRFIADLVQSIAFKNLMIDLGTLKMSKGQRAKDVKAFFQRLMHNHENWYTELEKATKYLSGKQPSGFLTHYAHCHPKGQTAGHHKKGNERRQQLVIVLKLTIDKLALKHQNSCYAESVYPKGVKVNQQSDLKSTISNGVKMPKTSGKYDRHRFVGGNNNNNNQGILMSELKTKLKTKLKIEEYSTSSSDSEYGSSDGSDSRDNVEGTTYKSPRETTSIK